MDSLAIYKMASVVLFAAAGVLAVCAVFLFFTQHIWQVIGKLTGARWAKVDEQDLSWSGGRRPAAEPPQPERKDTPVHKETVPPASMKTPAPAETMPLARAETPVAGGTMPLAVAEAPAVGGTMPLAVAEAPAVGGTMPLAVAEAPAAGGTIPLTGAEAPAAGGTIPLTGAEAPAAGGTIPLESVPGHTAQLQDQGASDARRAEASEAKRKLGFQPEETILVLHSEERL